MSKVLEIVCQVGHQGEYICGLGGVVLIWQHHLGSYSVWNQFAQQYVSALIC